jgi:hypothetical protein
VFARTAFAHWDLTLGHGDRVSRRPSDLRSPAAIRCKEQTGGHRFQALVASLKIPDSH